MLRLMLLISVLITSCVHVEVERDRKVSIRYQFLTPGLESSDSVQMYKENILGQLKTLAVKGYSFTLDENGGLSIDDAIDEDCLAVKSELYDLNARLENKMYYHAERGDIIFYEPYSFKKQFRVSVKDSYLILDDLVMKAIEIAKLPPDYKGVIKLANTVLINDLDLAGYGSFTIESR